MEGLACLVPPASPGLGGAFSVVRRSYDGRPELFCERRQVRGGGLERRAGGGSYLGFSLDWRRQRGVVEVIT